MAGASSPPALAGARFVSLHRAVTAEAASRRTALRWFWPALALALLALVVATHWPLRSGHFQLDDFLWLHPGNWRSVAESFAGSVAPHIVAYRPIFRVSVHLDLLAFGRNPVPWHFENLVWHTANCVLLAAVVRSFRVPLGTCAAAAILFALAPLSAEAVNYVSARGTLLSFLFMLLATWRWIAAARDDRLPWAAIAWMTLATMTYEAAVVLPAVFACLVPLVARRLAISPRRLAMHAASFGAFLALVWLLRYAILRTFLAEVDPTHPDLAANLAHHFDDLLRLGRVGAGQIACWVLAAALAASTFVPRLFPSGPVLVAVALILFLPYAPLAETGGRFFYMLQAPLCVMAVLPSVLFRPGIRLLALAALLAALLPGFARTTWHDAATWARDGEATRAIIAAVHRAIPFDTGVPHVVDGIGDVDRDGKLLRVMFGDFFVMAVADSYAPARPPVVMRSRELLHDAALANEVLGRATVFWRYDPATQRLRPADRDAWLAAHPETAAVTGWAASGASADTATSPADPAPVIVAVAATPSGDGVLRIPGAAGSAAFAVAALNAGAARSVRVSVSGAETVPAAFSVCRTEMHGQCVEPPSPALSTELAAGEHATFSVFVTAVGTAIPFDVANSRIHVRFRSAGGAPIGTTSVAVRTG